MTDPLTALHRPEEPIAPDPAFAAELRGRVIEQLLAAGDPGARHRANSEEPAMSAVQAIDRNGRTHGDISYLTLAVPDVAAAERFYGELFGWGYAPGRYGRSQGLEVIPQIGVYDGVRPDATVARGAILGFRVDDIATAVAAVRAEGGQAEEPAQRAYGLESLATDPDGTEFYLHQLDDHPDPDGPDLSSGRQHGDAAYFSFGVSELARSERFYHRVLGWTLTAGSAVEGRQIQGVTPMGGLWQGRAGGVRISYRVDDIHAAIAQIEALGGTASAVEVRPYGLAADECVDDRGLSFGLLQLG